MKAESMCFGGARVAACLFPMFLAVSCSSAGEDDTDAGEDPADGTGSDGGAGTESDGGVGEGTDLSLEWIELAGGTFWMGTEDNYEGNEAPRHQVTIPTIEMTKTEVTVANYRKCVEAGACTAPGKRAECNWPKGDERADHPVNCVKWQQSADFCEWVGGRLPSEAEWEFAARSREKEWIFPWEHAGDVGNDYCEYAVMALGFDDASLGCNEGGTWPVCSKPKGSTLQGICDMAGNLEEWTLDHTHASYVGAPTDGRPWVDPDKTGGQRVTRGGSYFSFSSAIRIANRYAHAANEISGTMGFRCVRPEIDWGEWDGNGAVENTTWTCDDFVDGWNNRFEVNGKRRGFILHLPEEVESGGPWPVIFNWYGLGDSADNFAQFIDLAGGPDNDVMPFIGVTPQDAEYTLTLVPMDWNVFKVGEENQEALLFDAILECLDERFGVDWDHVHSMGYSLGAILSDMLGTIRGDVIASLATYSGCYWSNEENMNAWLRSQINWPVFEERENHYSQLILRGGPTDIFPLLVTNINFQTCGANDTEMLNSFGHDVILCSHSQGHVGPVNGMSPLQLVEFFRDHPRGTYDTPYVADGVPSDFADYCEVRPAP